MPRCHVLCKDTELICRVQSSKSLFNKVTFKCCRKDVVLCSKGTKIVTDVLLSFVVMMVSYWLVSTIFGRDENGLYVKHAIGTTVWLQVTSDV